MTTYSEGTRVKVLEDLSTVGGRLTKGTKGIVTFVGRDTLEIAFEGVGLTSLNEGKVKKCKTKAEHIIKAKKVRITDEILLLGSGEFAKVASVERDAYENDSRPNISIQTVNYDTYSFGWNEEVSVRR